MKMVLNMKIKWEKKTIIKIIEYILAVLAISTMSLYLIKKASIQNDVFFDLKTGERILKYGIDLKDHFSFIPNLIYTYHHWLYDVIFYVLYQKYDFVMIKYFYLIVFFCFGMIVFYVNKKLNKSNLVGIILSVFVMYLASHFLQTRVQTITYGLLLFEYYLLERIYQTGKKRYIIPLIILSILIANLHMPIWILTLVFFLPFLAETILYYLARLYDKKKNWEIEKPKNTKVLFLAFFLVALTGLCTPLKFYPYTFFLKCLGNDTFTFINEMQKTQLITYDLQLYMILMIVVAAYFKLLKIKPRDFFYLVGLFLMALMARRHVAYLSIWMPILFVKSIRWDKLKDIGKEIWEKALKWIKKWKWMSKLRRQKYIGKQEIYFLVLIIPIAFLCCTMKNHIEGFQQKDVAFQIKVNYPYESVKYIKENLDYKNIKLHNSFNFGSYLEFYDIPVFIDSRAEVYMKEYNGGKDIINDYLKSKRYRTYKMYFNAYGFDYALVDKNDEIYKILMDDKDFELIFQESYYALLKRKD